MYPKNKPRQAQGVKQLMIYTNYIGSEGGVKHLSNLDVPCVHQLWAL